MELFSLSVRHKQSDQLKELMAAVFLEPQRKSGCGKGCKRLIGRVLRNQS